MKRVAAILLQGSSLHQGEIMSDQGSGKDSSAAAWIAIGAGIGAALGVALDNMATGMAIGIGIGGVIAFAISRQS